jgi:hypothetical protein
MVWSCTRHRHPNTNFEVGTQTQKDQHQSRDNGGSKSLGQDPENQRNRDDYVAVMDDSMLKFIDSRRLRNGTNKKLAAKTFPGAKVDDVIMSSLP